MTSVRNWEVHSRGVLEAVLNRYFDSIVEKVEEMSTLEEIVAEVDKIRAQLHKDLDCFKIQRVLYRHEIIFRGNSKIDIPD
jgi:regulator of protease activity HflC (stomatin/prohibitin superfamily)